MTARKAAPRDLGAAAAPAAADSAAPAASTAQIKPSRGEETPDQVHGRLLEGVHIGGYSFERAFNNLEWLLAEDRWRRVGGGFEDVNDFLAGIRLDEFRVVAEQRKRIALRIKQLQPAASNRSIAKVIGVDEITIRRDSATNVAPDTQKAAENKRLQAVPATNVALAELSGVEAAVLAKRRAERKAHEVEIRQQRAERQIVPLDLPPLSERCRLIYSPVAELATHIEPETVRAICRETAAGIRKSKLATMLASAKTVAAVERLSKADRRIAATAGQWDDDDEIINSPEDTT